MKQTTLLKMLAAGTACAVAIGTALAQQSTTTTTTTDPVTGTTTRETTTTDLSGVGTITAYTPGTEYITVRSNTFPEPVRYYYTNKTVLVDPTGRTIAWSDLRPDMPVTYTYEKVGDRMVVTKVTVTKPVDVIKKETTTTTTTTRP
jgi:ABC-type glycerol-3-phosphate transport system substrate-binding protein